MSPQDQAFTKASVEFLSSRSRLENFHRCPRARFLMDEFMGEGLSLIRQAVPLVTGGSFHLGAALLLAQTLKGSMDIDHAVEAALDDYDIKVKDRGFALEELEDQSFVYHEQKAHVEALVRLAGMRVIPRLLEQYEVLEVEKLDSTMLLRQGEPSAKCPLCGYDIDFQDGVDTYGESLGCPNCRGGSVRKDELRSELDIRWRSIPDALLRERSSGDLYILSWKTISEFGPKKDAEARVDMQGLSEAWALEQRLKEYWINTRTFRNPGDPLAPPDWFYRMQGHLADGPAKIRGIQMVYLMKGQRRKEEVKDAQGQVIQVVHKDSSPLLYGFSDGQVPAKFATSLFYQCQEPHSFRWAKGGLCPGGKNHKRGDEWTKFPTWETMGVKEWIRMLDSDEIPGGGNVLEGQFAIPLPQWRTEKQKTRWLRQAQAQERRIATALIAIREIEIALIETDMQSDYLWDLLEARLDDSFPQHTHQCANWFGRPCPMTEICHGPEHIARDPLGSGLFQIKEGLKEEGGQ